MDSSGSIPQAAAAAVAAAAVAAKQRLVQRVDAVDFAVEVRLERVEALGDRKALRLRSSAESNQKDHERNKWT